MAFAFTLAPVIAAAQATATPLVNNAMAQLNAGNLDSAAKLIAPLLASGSAPTPAARAAALVLHGVIAFFRGNDSSATADFEDALRVRPDVRADWVFALDSTLGRLWWRARNQILCDDPEAVTLDSAGRETTRPPVLTTKPQVVSIPEILLPSWAERYGVHGRVLAVALVNDAGRVTRESIKILRSPQDVLSSEVRWALERAEFQPGRVGERMVSVCVELPFDFNIGK